jgi:hypothetical protein
MSEETNLDDALMFSPDEGDARAEAIRESEGATDVVPAELPSALRDVDPQKLEELKNKLKQFIGSDQKTEADDEPSTAPTPEQTQQQLPTGKDVDWEEYDLDYAVKHLYPFSVLRPISDGSLHWVTMIDEFYSTTRAGKSHGKMVHNPADEKNPDSKTDPLNLGEYLTGMINGPERWKIAALLPGSGGEAVVLLQRQVPYVLPDPQPLKTLDKAEDEVEIPSDEELERTEKAALAFAAGEGLPVPEIDAGGLIDGYEFAPQEKIGTMHVQPLSPEDEGRTVREALGRNEQITEEYPGGEQPEAFDLDQPWLDGKTKIAAGIANIAAGMENILGGDDFGDLDTTSR